MPTFKEQLDRMTDLQHRLAVWEALREHLEENFVGRDGCQARKGIRVPGCPIDTVPEPTVEDILQFIDENHIQEIREEIARVERQEVGSVAQTQAGGN